MRIIAGRWGGRRLMTPVGSAHRPTQGRVREAVFSRLTDRIEGAVVLDLFAGSGSLGLEALSRGACRAGFVERSPRALAALRSNIAQLGAGESCQIMAGEVVSFLRGTWGAFGPVTLLFADPPYGDLAAHTAPKLVDAPGILWGEGALQVIECDSRDPSWPPAPGWVRWTDRVYGETRVVIDERDADGRT